MAFSAVFSFHFPLRVFCRAFISIQISFFFSVRYSRQGLCGIVVHRRLLKVPHFPLCQHTQTHIHTLVLTHTIESYLWKFYCNYKSFRMLFSSASSSSFAPPPAFSPAPPPVPPAPSTRPASPALPASSFDFPWYLEIHSKFLPPALIYSPLHLPSSLFPALFLFQLIHFGFRFVLLVRSLVSRFPTLSTSLFLLVFIALFRNLLLVCQFVVGFRFVSFRFDFNCICARPASCEICRDLCPLLLRPIYVPRATTVTPSRCQRGATILKYTLHSPPSTTKQTSPRTLLPSLYPSVHRSLKGNREVNTVFVQG